MCAVTTKPLKMEQLNHVIDSLEQDANWNYLTITLLLMKATRVGDLLKTITIGDVYDEKGNVRETLEYNEGKTGKHRIIPIKGDRLIHALNKVYQNNRLSTRPRDAGLFYSRKAVGRFDGCTISNVAVNANLQKFVGECGIEAISSHAIRKTSVRFMFENGTPIEVISRILNHSSSEVTYRYICINNQDVNKTLSLLEI